MFWIRLQILPPIPGNHKMLHATIGLNDAGFLRSQLGLFGYYHFLRDVFEDLSYFNREGDILFSKPGIGDLSVQWNINNNSNWGDIWTTLQAGIGFLSTTQKQKYWNKYSLVSSMYMYYSGENMADEDTFIISMRVEVFNPENNADSEKREMSISY